MSRHKLPGESVSGPLSLSRRHGPANWAHIRQSRPDSGLRLSRFAGFVLNCSLLVQVLLKRVARCPRASFRSRSRNIRPKGPSPETHTPKCKIPIPKTPKFEIRNPTCEVPEMRKAKPRTRDATPDTEQRKPTPCRGRGGLVLWKGFRESRRCSRDTYPESYITEHTLAYED